MGPIIIADPVFSHRIESILKLVNQSLLVCYRLFYHLFNIEVWLIYLPVQFCTHLEETLQ